MIANVSKNNTGKLLVAVLAMAMIVAGAAVVLGGSVSAAPAFNDEKTEVTVSTSEDLLTAIDGVNNSTGDYASVTTIILDGDEFDVTKASGNYIGSGFVISKDNITIRGADGTQPLIYADYSNSGMGTIDGINQQNTVTISGDNVTLQNLKIANMYTFIQVVDQSTQEVTDQYMTPTNPWNSPATELHSPTSTSSTTTRELLPPQTPTVQRCPPTSESSAPHGAGS